MAIGFQVTFDCADPDRLARFWAQVLGYKLQEPPEGYATWQDWLRDRGIPKERWNDRGAIVDPDGRRPRVFFQKVPEGKTAKNRVHLDVNVSGGLAVPLEQRRKEVDAAVERLVAAGATKIGAVEELGGYHVVMRDIEDNEFCLQ